MNIYQLELSPSACTARKGLPLRLKSRLVQIPKRATLLAIRNSGLVVLKTSYIFSQYSLGKYSLTPRVTVTIHVVHPQLKKIWPARRLSTRLDTTQVARDSDLGSWCADMTSQDRAKIIATAAGHLGVAIL